MSGLTIPQAAEVLGVDPGTLRRQIHQNRLKASKVGRDWFIESDEVERYSKEQSGKKGRKRTTL